MKIMSDKDKCSVVFIRQFDGWFPVDLTEDTEGSAPSALADLIKKLRQASAVSEDFDLYCVFMLDMDDGGLWLETLTAGESSDDPVVIPATVSSVVLVGLSMLLGHTNVKGLRGDYEKLEVPVDDGNIYVKYTNNKTSDGMKDECTCVYAYSKDCRFVGSYSTVDGFFIDKKGEKVEINGENQRVAEACFRLDRRSEDEVKV